MTTRTLWDVLYRRSGNYVTRISGRALLALKFDAPVLPAVLPDFSRRVEAARAALQAGVDGERGHPLPLWIRKLETIVLYQLEQYLEFGLPDGDRLYVLEFQGSRQYVMVGHTRNLLHRVNQHKLNAELHGFALLNAWASLGMANAQPLERQVLDITGDFNGDFHYRESFYGMSFQKVVAIARAVVDVEFERLASQ